jgi:hypothetical protein
MTATAPAQTTTKRIIALGMTGARMTMTTTATTMTTTTERRPQAAASTAGS